jgi:hypothetical protein
MRRKKPAMVGLGEGRPIARNDGRRQAQVKAVGAGYMIRARGGANRWRREVYIKRSARTKRRWEGTVRLRKSSSVRETSSTGLPRVPAANAASAEERSNGRRSSGVTAQEAGGGASTFGGAEKRPEMLAPGVANPTEASAASISAESFHAHGYVLARFV